MSRRIGYTVVGAGGGGSYGAIGFLGGPLVGLATTVGSSILGGMIGYFVGPCIDRCGGTVDKTNKVIDEGKKFIKKAKPLLDPKNNGVENFNKTVGETRNIFTTCHGGIILGLGIFLGAGMWKMGIVCDPTCNNINAELARLTALALGVTGIGLIGISTIRSIFSK